MVHSEDDFFVAEIKKQVPSFNSSIISYDALRGPIKIWEIHYPSDIEFKKEYLQRGMVTQSHFGFNCVNTDKKTYLAVLIENR